MTEVDIFLFSGHTADHQPLAIGGFCNPGHSEAVLAAYASIESFVFGNYRDPFVVDMRLSRLLREYSHPEVLLAGASIRLDGCVSPGGGVFGIPGTAERSADGIAAPLWDGMVSLALPGAFGLAMQAEHCEAQALEQLFQQINGVPSLCQARALVEQYTDTYLLVYDGSGGARGSVSIRRKDAYAFHAL